MSTRPTPDEPPSSPRAAPRGDRPRRRRARRRTRCTRDRRRLSSLRQPRDARQGGREGFWNSPGRCVVSAPSGPDQVDMTMGAHIDGFTRAWIDVAEPRARSTAMLFRRRRFESGRRRRRFGSVGAVCGAEALDALLGDVSDESDRTLISNALRAAAAVRAEDAREEWLAGNAFDRFVGRRSNENDATEEEEEEEGRTGEEGGGRANKPNACLMVVTTDNDLAPCLRRCRAAGIRVVVCGDYLPRPKRGPAPVERPRRGGGSRRGRGRGRDGGVLARAARRRSGTGPWAGCGSRPRWTRRWCGTGAGRLSSRRRIAICSRRFSAEGGRLSGRPRGRAGGRERGGGVAATWAGRRAVAQRGSGRSRSKTMMA